MIELIDIAIVLDQIIRAGLILGIAYEVGPILRDDWDGVSE